MKLFLKRLSVLVAVLAIIGVIVLVSGVVPIKASSGHWPITRWLLTFASSRSISTHSTGIKIPELDEPGMVKLGAGIYQSNCLWCHGSPSMKRPPAAMGMTPTPPYLPEVLSQWEPAELHYIVNHGIKFAGMPAWPVRHRSDEIWPAVAFLLAYTEMSEPQFQSLLQVPRDSEAPEVVMDACAICHGTSGEQIVSPRVPRLAGQNHDYLANTLRAYAKAERRSGVMQPIAARLDERQIEQIAAWYSNQSIDQDDPHAIGAPASRELIEAGKSLIESAGPNDKIAVCTECHRPDNDPGYPKLHGQPIDYLVQQLHLFQKRHRGGTEHAELMHPIADPLNEDQMHALAAYLSSSH